MSNRGVPTPKELRVVDAASGEGRMVGRKLQVIRGRLPVQQIPFLDIPEYQRLAMQGEKHKDLIHTLGPDGEGDPGDITVCVETEHFTAVGIGVIVVRGLSFNIVDGRQRFEASMARIRQGLVTDDLGVKIILGVSYEEQKKIFWQLNRYHTPVSHQKHLSNVSDNSAMAALRRTANNSTVIPRVQWDQQRQSSVITARMLYEVALLLHGYNRKSTIEEIMDSLAELTETVGNTVMSENTEYFFGSLLKCFPPNSTLGPKRYNVGLMMGLAMFLGRYENFWAESKRTKLLIRRPDIDRLAKISALSVEQYLGKNGEVRMIADLLARHRDQLRKDPSKMLQDRIPLQES